MKIPLLLLLLASVAFSAQISCLANATDIILGTEGTLILAVLGFTIVLIAAAYAAGSAFTNAEYIVFAKDEMYHLLFSVLLLLGFSGVLLLSCGTMEFFFASIFHQFDQADSFTSGCYTGSDSMLSTAKCYINMAKSDATRLTKSYISGYLNEMMDSTFAWGIQWPMMNAYTSTAGAFRKIVSSQYDLILNTFLIPALMSISMQKIILDFIRENIVQWILPAAFVMRIFIPTRQFGNILIAVVIALYILVPFMYVFTFAMYDIINNHDDCIRFASAVCDYPTDGGCSPAEQTCSNPDSFWQVARLIPVAFFLPNLTIAIIVTFLGSVHKALRVIG